MKSMWSIIAGIILRNRIPFLILLALLTAFFGYKATFVEMEYEYASMLPESDTAYLNYQYFKQLFGEDSNVLVVGFQDSSFFEVDKINHWLQVVDSIKQLDGVINVASVTSAYTLKKNTEEKKFDFKRLFPPRINDQKQLDSIVQELHNLPFYQGVIYNDTSHLFLMAVTMEKKKINSSARVAVIDKLENISRNFAKKYDITLHFSGLPYTRTRITQMIKGELNMFIILVALVTAFILFLFFRSFKVVLFALVIVGIGVTWSFGTMVLFGYKITILTGMIPPLLIVIGIPNCVFLLNKYHNEYQTHNNKIKALQRVIVKIGKATFLTNLTTAAGFFTFVLISSRVLVEFGVIASINIMSIFVLSILLIPIIFSFLPPPSYRHLKHLKYKRINRLTARLCVMVTKKRRNIYITIIVLFALGIFGISLLKSTGYIVDDIPHGNQVYVDLKFFEKHVQGVMPLEITVDTKKEKRIMRLSTMHKLNKLQKRLATYPEISNSTSITDGIKFIRQAYYGGNPEYYKLPSNQEISFLMQYLPKGGLNQNSMVSSFVDSSMQITRVSMRVADIGSVRMKYLTDSLQSELDSVFPPDKYDTFITGSSVVYTKGIKFLIRNMFTSLAIAIVLISIFMTAMFASFRMVVISLLPNFIPLLFTAAVMGFFGIPLKPSTILVFSISFGISVDGAIHFLAKYKQELEATNHFVGLAVRNSIREAGVSMMYTYIILFFGFGVFVISDFGGTKALGILVSITLLVSMLSNLIILPSLILTFNKFRTKDPEPEVKANNNNE